MTYPNKQSLCSISSKSKCTWLKHCVYLQTKKSHSNNPLFWHGRPLRLMAYRNMLTRALIKNTKKMTRGLKNNCDHWELWMCSCSLFSSHQYGFHVRYGAHIFFVVFANASDKHRCKRRSILHLFMAMHFYVAQATIDRMDKESATKDARCLILNLSTIYPWSKRKKAQRQCCKMFTVYFWCTVPYKKRFGVKTAHRAMTVMRLLPHLLKGTLIDD